MLTIAHRGASAHAPENTLAAFARAIELGAQWLELDIHACAGGELVVIHDATVDRTTDGTGRVAAMTLRELQALDAGGGERIPTLQEVCDLAMGRAGLCIEVKGDDLIAPLDAFVRKQVAAGWRYEDLVVFSFDHPQLHALSVRNPQVCTGATICGIPMDYTASAAYAGAWCVNVAVNYMNALLVADGHARGLQVFAYTANDPHDIRYARECGVDGIITDYPERVRAH